MSVAGTSVRPKKSSNLGCGGVSLLTGFRTRSHLCASGLMSSFNAARRLAKNDKDKPSDAMANSLCCFSCSGITTVISTDIPAPCDLVWEVMCDLDAIPSYLSSVEYLERTGGPKFDVGTRWRERRISSDGVWTTNKTITSISKVEPYSVQVTVTFDEMGWFLGGSACTATMTLGRSADDKDRESCQLMCTFAFASATWLSKVFYASCGRCLFEKAINEGVSVDLEDVNSEVLKRLEKSKDNGCANETHD